MKIESLIKRANGTTIAMDGETYHFKPDADGRHVCVVADTDHQERFLAIDEGFREFRAGDAPPELTAENKGAAQERAALVEEYKRKFNKKPHPQLGVEKLREAIENGIG